MTGEAHTSVTSRTAGSGSATKRRIVGLDGARGIACLGVLVLHVCGHYSPTTMAAFKVQLVGQTLILFFALSGFLLFLPYVKAIFAEPGQAKVPNTRMFALHRLGRIMPGYLFIFLVCSYVFQVVYLENASIQPVGTDQGTGMMTDPGMLAANLTLLQSYLPHYFQTGLNPSWSLSLEFVFYASLPLIGLATLAVRRRTSIPPAALACIGPVVLLIIGAIGKSITPLLQERYSVYDPVLVDWGPNWVAVLNRSFLGMADNFSFGMFAAVIFTAISTGALRGHPARRIRWYCSIAFVPASILALLLLVTHNSFANTAMALVAGLFVLFTVAPMARDEDSAFARALDCKPLKYLGEISLSVYLLHFPILLVLGRAGWMAGDSVAGMLRNLALVLTVTVVVATLTYRLVERPAMNLTKRYRPA